MCALFGKECYNCQGLSYRPRPSVTMTHIHNLCTDSCPRLLTFPFRPGQLPLSCITDTNCSWLIRMRGSHEEALGFHGTLLRIDPALTGSSLIKDANAQREILPVVSTVSQVMRPRDPWWTAGSLCWLSTTPLCPKYEKKCVFLKKERIFKIFKYKYILTKISQMYYVH